MSKKNSYLNVSFPTKNINKECIASALIPCFYLTFLDLHTRQGIAGEKQVTDALTTLLNKYFCAHFLKCEASHHLCVLPQKPSTSLEDLLGFLGRTLLWEQRTTTGGFVLVDHCWVGYTLCPRCLPHIRIFERPQAGNKPPRPQPRIVTEFTHQ